MLAKAVVFAGTMFLSVPATAQTMPFLTVGSGDVQGGYYAAAREICDNVNQLAKGSLRCSTDPTAGSIYNLEALRRGELDFALVQSDLHAQAVAGTGRFTTAGPMPELRSVIGLYTETMTILVGAQSGVSDLAGLLGKRVDLGQPFSGRRATSERMLDLLDMDLAQFSEVAQLPAGTAIDALCSGVIDATFLVVGHPNANVNRAVNDCGARIISLSTNDIETVTGAAADLIAVAIPASEYAPGAISVPSVAVTATLVTLQDTPPEIVETIVSDTLGALEMLGRRAPVLAGLEASTMARQGLTAPLHPGAATAFARAGVTP